MFIPLLHYRTKFEIFSTLSPEEFARHLFREVRPDLEESYMTRRWEHKCDYEFSGPVFRFIWNGFNRFNGIKRGSLHVTKNMGEIQVSAQYEFQEIFFLCLLFCMIPLCAFWGPNEWRIILLVLIWLVYLINFVVSYLRLNTYFKRKVRDTFIDHDPSHEKKLL